MTRSVSKDPRSDNSSLVQANALAPNWGQSIFQSAHEIVSNTALRKRLDDIQAQNESEKQWWEKRRAQMQSELLKELDDSEKLSTKAASEEDAVLVDTPSKSSGKKKGKK